MTPMLSGDPSSITSGERAAYVSYERQRRLRMLRSIAFSFTGLSLFALVPVTLFFLVFLPLAQRNWLALGAVNVVLVLTALANLWCYLESRRGHLLAPSIVIMVTAGLGAAAIQFLWDLTQGVDDFSVAELTALSVVIILAGVLGNGWMIVCVTLVMNGISVGILLATPHSGDFPKEITLVVPSVVLFQWIFAAIMIGVWLSFQRSIGELGVAYQRARQLDDLKSQFITSVNHELRTPLMALQNYIKLLQLPALEPQDAHLAVTQANTVLDALVDLVQSILSTRQLDREGLQVTPEAVDIREVLDTAIQLLDPREGGGVERPLTITIPNTVLAWADRTKLQQILTNLLSNAIKYSPPGSPIEVTASPILQNMPAAGRFGRAISTQQPMVEITVRDHGLGIPPDQIPLLFNRFTRLPRDLASNVSGNGLGLYLCRTFTEAMEGRIEVTSSGQEGDGSLFTLWLPAPTPALVTRRLHSRPLRDTTLSHS